MQQFTVLVTDDVDPEGVELLRQQAGFTVDEQPSRHQRAVWERRPRRRFWRKNRGSAEPSLLTLRSERTSRPLYNRVAAAAILLPCRAPKPANLGEERQSSVMHRENSSPREDIW